MPVVSRRAVARLAALAIAALGLPVRGLPAQRCIGHTAYVVRDETGAVMTAEQMARLTIRSFDGIVPESRRDSVGGAPYYTYKQFAWPLRTMQSVPLVALRNPLQTAEPLATCGAIGELTLVHAGRTMRLLFDIEEHNTYYEIDGPRFQDGTFRLRGLRCRDGARPPRIDNVTSGKCLVAADAWERVPDEPFGHVVGRDLSGGPVDRDAASCRNSAGRQLEAITSPAEWEAAWKAYPSVVRGEPLPQVDFTTEIVLVVYRPTFMRRSIHVDDRGDLTYMRLVGMSAPMPCAVLFVAVQRSGVRSIDGRPLPAAPAR